jgi:hypothetical protein
MQEHGDEAARHEVLGREERRSDVTGIAGGDVPGVEW